MINPQALLPVVKGSFPKGNDAQILEALAKLAKAHPNLDNMQALAAIQKFLQEKKNPSMGMYARQGGKI